MIYNGASARLPRCDKNQSRLAMTRNCILSLLNHFPPTKCLAVKVLPHGDNHLLPINIFCAVKLRFGNGTYQPKTSERRRIRTKADYYKLARRGGSDQHVFRWYVPLTKWLLPIVKQLDCQARLLKHTLLLASAASGAKEVRRKPRRLSP